MAQDLNFLDKYLSKDPAAPDTQTSPPPPDIEDPLSFLNKYSSDASAPVETKTSEPAAIDAPKPLPQTPRAETKLPSATTPLVSSLTPTKTTTAPADSTSSEWLDDITKMLTKGAIQLPVTIGRGLEAVATIGQGIPTALIATAAGKPLPTAKGVEHYLKPMFDKMGESADALGLPAWARPSQWTTLIEESYSPKQKYETAAAQEVTEAAKKKAEADGSGTAGKIIAEILGTAEGLYEHPRAAVPIIAENIPQLFGMSKLVASATKPMQAALNAQVKAGTITAEAADKALGKVVTNTSYAVEGLFTTGQQPVDTEDETLKGKVAAIAAGITTAMIAKGAGKIPGLDNPEAVLANKFLGREVGYTGGLPERIAKGMIAEGLIQEPAQSGTEQVWGNIAQGKPWDEGIGEQIVKGAVGGLSLGGVAGLASTRSDTPSEPSPTATEIAGLRAHPLGDVPTVTDPEVTAAKIADTTTVDEAIATAQRETGQAATPVLQEQTLADKLEAFIGENRTGGEDAAIADPELPTGTGPQPELRPGSQPELQAIDQTEYTPLGQTAPTPLGQTAPTPLGQTAPTPLGQTDLGQGETLGQTEPKTLGLTGLGQGETAPTPLGQTAPTPLGQTGLGQGETPVNAIPEPAAPVNAIPEPAAPVNAIPEPAAPVTVPSQLESIIPDTLSPVITGNAKLDAFIGKQQADGESVITTHGTATQIKMEKARDQRQIEEVFSAFRDAGFEGVVKKPNGGMTYMGQPVAAVHPSELPVTVAPDVQELSQEKYSALSTISKAVFNKRLVLFDAPGVDGLVFPFNDPGVVYLRRNTKGADLFSVMIHEQFHLLEGTPFHSALKEAVWKMRTPEAKAHLVGRHGNLRLDHLKNEMVSDIAGTEMNQAKVWEKVYSNLEARVGTKAAIKETGTFINTLKTMVATVKDLITSTPWKRGQKLFVEQLVVDLEKVHDLLAATVADAIYRSRENPVSGTGGPVKSEPMVVHPETAREFQSLAKEHRGPPTEAMFQVQQIAEGGPVSQVVEHVSNLTRHLTENVGAGETGRAEVKHDVKQALNLLTPEYANESAQHLKTVGQKYDRTGAQMRSVLDPGLAQYTKAHRTMRVYNRPQWLAREAAVAVGENRVEDAVAHLNELDTLASANDFPLHALSIRRESGHATAYREPVKVSALDAGSYALEQPIRDKKVGEIVTEFELNQMGYRAEDSVKRSPDQIKMRAKLAKAGVAVEADERTTVRATVPSSTKPVEGAQSWTIGLDQIRASAGHLKTLVAALRAYPMLTGKGTSEQVLTEFKTKAVKNLLWLYDLVPENIRDRAKRWYSGANTIAKAWGEQDGYTFRQHAGVMAVLSPQKDWFMNMGLADRVRIIVKRHENTEWSPEMTAWVEMYRNAAQSEANTTSREELLIDARRLEGTTLGAMDNADAAKFVRIYDETNHSRHYRLVTPEGGFGDYVRGQVESTEDLFGKVLGPKSQIAWGSFNMIEKAVSILRNGSHDNIDRQLGNMHKVRNFFNNMAHPESTEGHVTIDTHAVGAAILNVVAADSKEVTQAFGAAGSNRQTGARGSYGLLADAYRDAAAKRTIPVHEFQSVTWEAIRSLFPWTMKKELKPKVDAIWKEVRQGTRTVQSARERIYILSGGIKKFAWEDGGEGLSPKNGGVSFDEGEFNATASTATEPGVPQRRGISRSNEPLREPRRPYQGAGKTGRDLIGLPSVIAVDGEDVEFHAFKPAQVAAANYMKRAGLTYTPETVYHKLNPALSKKIADAYTAMTHDPNDPDVKAAYAAMIKETLAQYEEIMKTGLVVEFFPENQDTYGNPRNAILDVVEHNHFYVFSTRGGFGSNAQFDASTNPLLAETDILISGEKALVNDLFRVVHDYFGHIKDGVGFRAEGEDNAWYSHVQMFSPLAGRALTTETRGQNSWVNYGPHGEVNRKATPASTVYADQKTGLLPEFVGQKALPEGVKGPSFSPEQVDVIRRLASKLPLTRTPGNTHFLLPDGRRLTAPKSMISNSSHWALANYAGVKLEQATAAGAIRYLPHFGIEISAPMSTTQAETLIDDWFLYNTTIQVDVVGPVGGVVLSTREFDIPNEQIDASGLQAFVARVLDTGERPTLSRDDDGTPPIGLTKRELPVSARVPKVDWNAKQAQDWISVNPQDWKNTGWGTGTPTVYKSYVPQTEMPQVRVALDLGNEYDWKQFKKGGVYPPLVIVIHRNGIAQKLEDGHHRATFWKEQGFTHFPAYIVDFRKDVTKPVFASKDETAPIWFSGIKTAIDAKMPTNASKSQVRAILSGPGVKQDEVKWTGINSFIDASPEIINKKALLDWLNTHAVVVHEVVKNTNTRGREEDLPVELRQTLQEFNRNYRGGEPANPEEPVDDDSPMVFEHRDFPFAIIGSDAEGWSVDVYDGVGENKQFLGDIDDLGQLRPGGVGAIFNRFHTASEQAYEYFVNDPIRQLNMDIESRQTQYEGYSMRGGEDYTELLLTLPTAPRADKFEAAAQVRYRKPFSHLSESQQLDLEGEIGEEAFSGHRPEEFKSAHWDEPNIVAHVRFDTRGKTLFVQEVQSDWHEMGRKKGYTSATAVAERAAEQKAVIDEISKYTSPRDANGWSLSFLESHKVPGELRQRWWDSNMRDPEQVPQAPFAKTWPELVMKRMLRWAAEHGMDRLAWTTGAQQNERYGLAKQIDAILVTNVSYEGERAPTYRLTAFKDSRKMISKMDLSESDLVDMLGKELTQKVMDKFATPIQDGMTGVARVRTDVHLEGIELEVGGSGMKYFYDKMLPSFMEKYLKPFGAKVEMGALSAEIDDVLGDPQTATVHSITLTPEMKASVITRGQPMFSRNAVPTYAIEPPGKLDKYIRLLQNKNIDTQRVVEAIRATGATINEALNPVLAEEMYQKRAEQQSKDFTDDELRPLIEEMREKGVTLEQMDDYLHARHVVNDAVNARLKAMNPTLPKNDALSGMTDAKAAAILAEPNAPIIAGLAKKVDDMITTTRKLMVDYGLEKQTRIDAWKQQYNSYVPLRREGFEDDGHPTGTGRSVRGTTVRVRGGSNLAVENILANIAQERDQVITRGEKMKPVMAMAGLLMMHPNPAIGVLDKYAPVEVTDPRTGLTMTVPGNLATYKVPTVRRFDQKSGTMKNYPDPMYTGRDNVVNFRIKGEDYAIVFNETNERAMEVAKAFRELDTVKLTGIAAIVAPYTRYLAAINTQYNPIFGIVNFVRDTQFAMLTLSSTPLAGKQAQVLKNTIGALRGIYQEARDVRKGAHTTSAVGRMWQRFEHIGGPTGYRDLFFTSAERAKDIERMLNPTFLSTIRSPQDTYVLQWLSDYNLTMENSIRLGVFKTAVDGGMSDLEAASLAKNITVNFNKKGQIGAQAGALYAFFNANVQGTARIAETLFERTPAGFRLSANGKRIVTGGLLLGVLQTFALAMAGFDDDDPPEFVKQKNLVIPLPGTAKKYIMVPMPLGFNLLPTVGRLAAESVKAGIEGRPSDIFKKGAALFSALFGTLSPTGGTGGVQELAPTVADPFVALATNTDWSGRSISKEDHSSLDPTPGHSRAKDTATIWAKGIATAINWATGGSDFTPGVLSPTPDAIDYLVGQVTGGIGREVSKTAQVAKSLYTGEELPTHKIPLAGRFVGSGAGSSAVRARFYENIKQANIAWNEVQGRALSTQSYADYLKTHPEARFAKAGVKIQSDLSELQKQKQRMIAKGASKEMIVAQEDRITALMTRFNTLVGKRGE